MGMASGLESDGPTYLLANHSLVFWANSRGQIRTHTRTHTRKSSAVISLYSKATLVDSLIGFRQNQNQNTFYSIYDKT